MLASSSARPGVAVVGFTAPPTAPSDATALLSGTPVEWRPGRPPWTPPSGGGGPSTPGGSPGATAPATRRGSAAAGEVPGGAAAAVEKAEVDRAGGEVVKVDAGALGAFFALEPHLAALLRGAAATKPVAVAEASDGSEVGSGASFGAGLGGGEPLRRLLVTGQSGGGAVAAVAALHFAHASVVFEAVRAMPCEVAGLQPDAFGGDSPAAVSLVTFGSPAVLQVPAHGHRIIGTGVAVSTGAAEIVAPFNGGLHVHWGADPNPILGTALGYDNYGISVRVPSAPDGTSMQIGPVAYSWDVQVPDAT